MDAEIAEAMLASPDYTDRAEACTEKATGGVVGRAAGGARRGPRTSI